MSVKKRLREPSDTVNDGASRKKAKGSAPSDKETTRKEKKKIAVAAADKSDAVAPTQVKAGAATAKSVAKGSKKSTSTASFDPKVVEALHPSVLRVFQNQFTSFTDIQSKCIVELLAHRDVVAQAPTGSGKTLAFVLPAISILLRRKEQWASDECGVLILAPSRELAMQIASVAKPYTEAVGLAAPHVIVGGVKNSLESNSSDNSPGMNIIVATPGRLSALLDDTNSGPILRRALKQVELLVLDETDRFTDLSLKDNVQSILAVVPKLRRTGLFSATQSELDEDRATYGLRNPIKVTVSGELAVAEQRNLSTPDTLHNHYAVVPGDQKTIALIEFIRQHPKEKLLVFLPTSHVVKYLHGVLQRVFTTKRKIYQMYGGSATTRKRLEKFERNPTGVMLATDVLARGVHIDGVNWVLQYDIPRRSSWLLHRAGRTARAGAEGHALLLLTPQQAAYLDYVQKQENIKLERLKLTTVTALKAEQLRVSMQKYAIEDRLVMLRGTRAFTSYIMAYKKHDARIVCSLKDLDVAALAHSLGLLRLPRMIDIKEHNLVSFKRHDIDTSTVAYKNSAMEAKRQAKLASGEMQIKKKPKSTKKGSAVTTDVEMIDESESAAATAKKTPKTRVASGAASAKSDKSGKAAAKSKSKTSEKKPKKALSDEALMRTMKGGRLSKKEKHNFGGAAH